MKTTNIIPVLAMAVGLIAFAPANVDAQPNHRNNKSYNSSSKHKNNNKYKKNNNYKRSNYNHNKYKGYHSNAYRPYKPSYKAPKRENLSISINPYGGINMSYSEYNSRYGYGYGYPGYRY